PARRRQIRYQSLALHIILARARHFEFHQLREVLVADALPKLLLSVAELAQVQARQIDSIAGDVLAEVAQNVRQLKRDSSGLSMLLGRLFRSPPDMDAR